MNEIFEPVPNYKNYIISNKGVLKSVLTGRRLNPKPNNKGYIRVVLFQNGVGKSFSIHRLVAEVFVDNPNNYEVVNHLDGNKLNNNSTNLEWCTQAMNVLHAKITGLTPKGSRRKQSKLNESQIEEILNSGFPGTKLVEMYGVHRSTISAIKRGRYWNHVKSKKSVKRSKLNKKGKTPFGVQRVNYSKTGKPDRFRSVICSNNKTINLGSYDTEEEAWRVVKDKFYELYGVYPNKYSRNTDLIRRVKRKLA